MNLLLHIGTEKTGTTSIQDWLAGPTVTLDKDGIWYPVSLRNMNDHGRLTLCAMDGTKTDNIGLQFGLDDPVKRSEFIAETRAAFAAEYAEAKEKKARWCVISSEHLHSRLFDHASVEAVRGFLDGYFDHIEVVLYLRPQVDLAVSLASTASRLGHTVLPTWFRSISSNDLYYNYDALVDRWEAVFGAEALSIVPYRQQMSVLDWFVERLGLAHPNLKQAARKNKAISFSNMQLVNHIDQTFDRTNGTRNPNLRIGPYLDHLPNDQPLILGQKLIDKITAEFAESNKALIARRSDISLEDLTPVTKPEQQKANAWRLSTDPGLAKPFSALIERLQAEAKYERALRHMSDYERDTLRAERSTAMPANRKSLQKARALLVEAQQCESLKADAADALRQLTLLIKG